jgi:tetratricopeptide (TPR) repeat protein
MNWKLSLALLALLGANMGSAQIPRPSEAVALEQEGKLAQATAAWRSIVTAKPKDAEAFASLGFVLSEQEQYEQAVPAYHRALALNPRLRGVQLNLGLAEFKARPFRGGDLPAYGRITCGSQQPAGANPFGHELLRGAAV